MQRRKGFTLVELVVVIAVIAILLGVMIGTFASVINRANESAKMQEMKAQEIEQKANDIIEKVNNSNWLGWEDLESKIGESIQKGIATELSKNSKDSIAKTDLDEAKIAIINAVDEAVAKYAQAAGQDNTMLTAEQVQYIVEQAVSKKGGVTEAQVKAIVNSAVGSINTGLSGAQVQKIVDAAVTKVTASGLSAADVATAVNSALANVSNKSDVSAIINKINAATAGLSTLTEKEIADIVSKYINSNGETKGDYTWFTSEKELSMPASEPALQALSVLSKNGETFKGKTIKITELLTAKATAGNIKSSTDKVITLTEKWIPIQAFEGVLDGDGYTIEGIDVAVVYWASKDQGSTGTTYTVGTSSSGWYGERKAFGFIGRLSGTVKNLTLDYSTEFKDPLCTYSYFGGVAGVAQGTATIENVTVTGTIEGYYSMGGLLGTIYNYCSTEKYDTTTGRVSTNYDGEVDVTLKNNVVSATVHSNSNTTTEAHSASAGLIGEFKKFWIGKVTLDGNDIGSLTYIFQSNDAVDNINASEILTTTTAPQTSERYVNLKSGVTAVEIVKTISTPDKFAVTVKTSA